MGQDCYLLGYPETWNVGQEKNEHSCLLVDDKIRDMPFPFIKKAIISKLIQIQSVRKIIGFFVDTTINKGFSGGMVVIVSNTEPKIIGVISGFKQQ